MTWLNQVSASQPLVFWVRCPRCWLTFKFGDFEYASHLCGVCGEPLIPLGWAKTLDEAQQIKPVFGDWLTLLYQSEAGWLTDRWLRSLRVELHRQSTMFTVYTAVTRTRKGELHTHRVLTVPNFECDCEDFTYRKQFGCIHVLAAASAVYGSIAFAPKLAADDLASRTGGRAVPIADETAIIIPANADNPYKENYDVMENAADG